MLTQFRSQYPHGGLISELITIDRGQYIVKVTLHVEGTTLSTGLAAADKIEIAEDVARERALLALGLEGTFTPLASAVKNHTETSVNKPSKVVNLSFEPESTTSRQLPTKETPVEQVQPLPVNPPSPSMTKPIDKVEPEINHAVETSNSPESVATILPEMEQHDFHYAPPELSSPTSPAQPETAPTQTLETVEFDFNEIIDKTDIEIKRLGWTKEQGRDFLLEAYGKRSRLHLTNQELMDFLSHLASQPS